MGYWPNTAYAQSAGLSGLAGYACVVGSFGVGDGEVRLFWIRAPAQDGLKAWVEQIADMFGVPRSTVYGHLDKTKTVPRQPKKNPVTKS